MRIFKRFALIGIIAAMALSASAGLADTYKVDRSHSAVNFSVRHLVSKVHGRFTDFEGMINYDAKNPGNSSVDIVVQAKSINTDNERRDNHLRSGDFFAADSFPTLTFKSAKAVKTDKGLAFEGTLIVRGISKQVTIPVEVFGQDGAPVMGFSATFVVNRKEFNVLWNRDLDQGGMLLGDDVTVTLDFEAKIPKEKQ